jgi:hypothetical protein
MVAAQLQLGHLALFLLRLCQRVIAEDVLIRMCPGHLFYCRLVQKTEADMYHGHPFLMIHIWMQDRCMICAERIIGSKNILNAPDGTPR